MGGNFSSTNYRNFTPWFTSVAFCLGRRLAPNTSHSFSVQLMQYSLTLPKPHSQSAYYASQLIRESENSVITMDIYVRIVEHIVNLAAYVSSSQDQLQLFTTLFQVQTTEPDTIVSSQHQATYIHLTLITCSIRAIKHNDSDALGLLLGLVCALNAGPNGALAQILSMVNNVSVMSRDESSLSIILDKSCRTLTTHIINNVVLTTIWLTSCKVVGISPFSDAQLTSNLTRHYVFY